jgi:Isochorismatase family
VVKHRISPFVGTDLETLLRANGIDTLVLAGARWRRMQRASTLLGRTLQQTPGFDGDAVPLRFRFQERRQCVRNSFATKQLPAREHPPASGE